jgi:methanethiol S-methyltransferase
MSELTSKQIWDLAIDAVLVLGFGFQHSIIAMIRLKKLLQHLTGMDPVSWRGVQSLINVSYVIMAAILWRDVDVVVWSLSGPAYWAVGAVLVLGWLWYLQIHLFEYDLGMAFGSSAVISRLMGRNPPRMEMWKVGTRRWLRFPVHTAFFPMFFAFPVMTASTLVMAIAGTISNIYGTILYDKRLERLVGDTYRQYQARTGLLFPPALRSPAGAKDMSFPAPQHWARLSQNLPGIVMGVLAGLFYWQVLGLMPRTTDMILTAWGCSFLVAVVTGVVIGGITSAAGDEMPEDYGVLLTRLATNAALVSGVGLATWWIICLAKTLTLPFLFIALPMWITVLWVGHAVSFASLRLARPAQVRARFAHSGPGTSV